MIFWITFCNVYVFKSRTKRESIQTYVCYTGWNSDTCEALATLKNTVAEARHTVSDCHACKILATAKCIIAKGSHAIGDYDACKSVAKCTIANGNQAIGKNNVSKPVATGECAFRNSKSSFF